MIALGGERHSVTLESHPKTPHNVPMRAQGQTSRTWEYKLLGSLLLTALYSVEQFEVIASWLPCWTSGARDVLLTRTMLFLT